MVNSLQIAEKIREYLYGKVDLHSFREWVVGSHLEMQEEKAHGEILDMEAARLLAEIEGRYAEFSDEIVSKENWKKRLAALISPAPQSAESYLLTLFYAVPSAAFQLNSMNISNPVQGTGNSINDTSNFREPDKVAV